MASDELKMLRACFAALVGQRSGWLNNADAEAAVEAVERFLHQVDPEWTERFATSERHATRDQLVTHSTGSTLTQFSGHMTRLYAQTMQAIDEARKVDPGNDS